MTIRINGTMKELEPNPPREPERPILFDEAYNGAKLTVGFTDRELHTISRLTGVSWIDDPPRVRNAIDTIINKL